MDKDSGKPKGYVFCEYFDRSIAECAVRNLNGREVSSRALRVDFAEDHAAGGGGGERDNRDGGRERERGGERDRKDRRGERGAPPCMRGAATCMCWPSHAWPSMCHCIALVKHCWARGMHARICAWPLLTF